MLKDPAALFSEQFLFFLAELPLFPLGVRVEEGLDLVLMVMELHLFLVHVRMSHLELLELIIGFPLLLVDLTLPLRERRLVLPPTIVYFRCLIVLLLRLLIALLFSFVLGRLLLL